jgi:hypothetical protein
MGIVLIRKAWAAIALLTGALLWRMVGPDGIEMFDYRRDTRVWPVGNKIFKDHCGSCHYAYQPGWLPAKSWEKLLNTAALRRHFGENAALDRDTLRTLHDYAVANAADTSSEQLSRKVMLSLAAEEAPLRITDVRYIYRKHHDIPRQMYAGNKDVKSLSNCDKCHTQAGQGLFGADGVIVPNYSQWKD